MVRRYPFSLLLLFVGLPFVGVLGVQAQSLASDLSKRPSPSAYYAYSEPGDVTILVSVWGSVRFPGLYQVAEGTRLSELFSLAGGPDISARDINQNRTIDVSLSRLQGDQRTEVFAATMTDEIFVSPQDLRLQSNDVLLVEVTIQRRFSWRDVAPIVAAVGTIGLTIAQFVVR